MSIQKDGKLLCAGAAGDLMYTHNSVLLRYHTLPVATDTTTGTDDIIENHNDIKIYPNPANNIITITTIGNNKKATVYISDISGKLVKTSVINNNDAIDISTLNDGLYIIKVNTNDYSYTQKINIIH